MALEDFRAPRTPESRTPYVLALLTLIGLVRGLWAVLGDWAYGAAFVLAAAAAAIAYAVFRFLRQPVRQRRRL
jgi:hypothetical protein